MSTRLVGRAALLGPYRLDRRLRLAVGSVGSDRAVNPAPLVSDRYARMGGPSFQLWEFGPSANARRTDFRI